jgi:hypothetical protein
MGLDSVKGGTRELDREANPTMGQLKTYRCDLTDEKWQRIQPLLIQAPASRVSLLQECQQVQGFND